MGGFLQFPAAHGNNLAKIGVVGGDRVGEEKHCANEAVERELESVEVSEGRGRGGGRREGGN